MMPKGHKTEELEIWQSQRRSHEGLDVTTVLAFNAKIHRWLSLSSIFENKSWCLLKPISALVLQLSIDLTYQHDLDI